MPAPQQFVFAVDWPLQRQRHDATMGGTATLEPARMEVRAGAVRAGAVRGLGTLGDRRAIPLLQRAVAGEIPYESPMSLVIDLDWYEVEVAARDALRALRSQ